MTDWYPIHMYVICTWFRNIYAFNRRTGWFGLSCIEKKHFDNFNFSKFHISNLWDILSLRYLVISHYALWAACNTRNLEKVQTVITCYVTTSSPYQVCLRQNSLLFPCITQMMSWAIQVVNISKKARSSCTTIQIQYNIYFNGVHIVSVHVYSLRLSM